MARRQLLDKYCEDVLDDCELVIPRITGSQGSQRIAKDENAYESQNEEPEQNDKVPSSRAPEGTQNAASIRGEKYWEDRLELALQQMCQLRDKYWPLIEEAVEEQDDETSILEDENPGGYNWHSKLWAFVFRIRSDDWLRGLGALRAFEIINFVLSCKTPANEDDAWAYHFPQAEIREEEAEAEFHSCWNDAKFYPGFDPLLEATRTAKPVLIDSLPRLYSRFLSVVVRFRLLNGADTFYLPQEKLSSLLGCDQSLISRFIKRAAKEGIVQLTRRGNSLSRKASEYRFAAEALPQEIQHAYGLVGEGCVVAMRKRDSLQTERRLAKAAER